MTVVRKEDDKGILEQAQFVYLIQEAAQPAVGHRNLRRVQGTHPLQLPFGEVVAGTLAGDVGLPTGVVAIVEVDILLWRIPRLVWVIAVYHHEERLGPARGLEQ